MVKCAALTTLRVQEEEEEQEKAAETIAPAPKLVTMAAVGAFWFPTNVYRAERREASHTATPLGPTVWMEQRVAWSASPMGDWSALPGHTVHTPVEPATSVEEEPSGVHLACFSLTTKPMVLVLDWVANWAMGIPMLLS